VLNRWQKLFGNLTEKQRKGSTTLAGKQVLAQPRQAKVAASDRDGALNGVKNCMRVETKFLSRIKLIWVVQSPRKKYFYFRVIRNVS